jgi:cation diffusion facilitator family transporter
MDAQLVDAFRHEHVFLGEAHDRNERKTWFVIAICTVMMVAEIVGGIWFGSVALIADGLHMSTHAGAMLIAALAYTYSRKHADDPRFSFGTGKLGDLAAFASAIVLAMVAVLIGYEAIERLFNPVPISFREAIPIAFVGLVVNLVSAFLLRDDHHHHGHGHGHDHGHVDEEHHDHHEHDDDHDHHHDHDHDHDHHHAHDHDHDHDHAHDRHAAYRRDNNLRAAFVHVASDVVVSVLVIIGLFAAQQLGWLWLDPVIGLLAATVVAIWSWSLVRAAGAILLDMTPDRALPRKIAERLERNGDRISDLHVWRVGPGHVSAIVTLVCDRPELPSVYKSKLADLPHLSHLTIEVEQCPGVRRLAQ